MAKILLVDDDSQLSQTVESFLKANNHTCNLVASGEDALQLLDTYNYDAIVLDWGLPGISGFAVCVEYRKRGGQTPICFLTGKNDLDALEEALNAGADDYVAKPFYMRELYARLKTLLRRKNEAFKQNLSVRGVTLHPELGKVEANGKSVMLRSKEAAILECLMRNLETRFSSQQLLDAVWPADAAPTTNSVRVWVTFLRQKLAEVGAENLITTVAGAGYTITASEPGS